MGKVDELRQALSAADRSREEHRVEMVALQDRADKAQIRTTQLTTLVQDLEAQLSNALSALSEAEKRVLETQEVRSELVSTHLQLKDSHTQCADLQAQLKNSSEERLQSAI